MSKSKNVYIYKLFIHFTHNCKLNTFNLFSAVNVKRIRLITRLIKQYVPRGKLLNFVVKNPYLKIHK